MLGFSLRIAKAGFFGESVKVWTSWNFMNWNHPPCPEEPTALETYDIIFSVMSVTKNKNKLFYQDLYLL